MPINGLDIGQAEGHEDVALRLGVALVGRASVALLGALGAVRPHEPLLEWYTQQPHAPPLPDGPSLESDDVVRPSERELQRNSRSRQGLLHVLRKRHTPRLAHLEKRAYKLPGWADAVAPIGGASAGAAGHVERGDDGGGGGRARKRKSSG